MSWTPNITDFHNRFNSISEKVIPVPHSAVDTTFKELNFTSSITLRHYQVQRLRSGYLDEK